MKKSLRIAIAQINCTVGDFEGNYKKICDYLKLAKGVGAGIISFPELTITGYPPEDLLLKSQFIDDNLDILKRIVKSVDDLVAVIGFVDKVKNDIYNAAAIIYEGKIAGIYHKALLPNYGVFDEKRYFKPGANPSVFRLGEFVLGINICEDIWHKEGPICPQASSGARLIINLNSSPYHAGKIREREEIVRGLAKANNVFISYANLVGGQDELVFDGQSMIVDNTGKVIGRAAAFREELLAADIDIPVDKKRASKNAITITDKFNTTNLPILPKKETKPLDITVEVYQALQLGLKD